MVLICRVNDFEIPLNVPWSATVPVAPAATSALNGALEAPAGTTTQAGVLTPGLLLVTPIRNPPAGEDPVILTLQEAAPGAATED